MIMMYVNQEVLTCLKPPKRNANLLLFMMDCVCMALYRMHACVYFFGMTSTIRLNLLLILLLFLHLLFILEHSRASVQSKSQTTSHVYITCKIIFSIFSKTKMCYRKGFNGRFFFLKKKKKMGF